MSILASVEGGLSGAPRLTPRMLTKHRSASDNLTVLGVFRTSNQLGREPRSSCRGLSRPHAPRTFCNAAAQHGGQQAGIVNPMTIHRNQPANEPGWIANSFGPFFGPNVLPKIFDCSRPQSDRIKRRPDFPKPIYLGPRMPRWRAHEVEAWIEAQTEEVA